MKNKEIKIKNETVFDLKTFSLFSITSFKYPIEFRKTQIFFLLTI